MVFGLLDVVLIVILASAFVVARSINQSSKQKFVQEAIPLKSAVQDLALQMVNEETGSRGYVITGNRAALQPLTAGRERVPDDLQVIADTVPAEPTLGAELARAREEIATLDRYYDTQIALVSSGPAGRRAAATRVRHGKALFDAFRETAGQMLVEADRVVADARQAQNSRYLTLLILLLVFGGAGLTVAIALTLRTPRRTHDLMLELEFERAAGELLLQREQHAHGEVEVLVGRLQQSLLPVVTVPDPRVDVATIYRPGEQRLDLGGDFYDCMQLEDGRLALLIGDVSGHGPDAAALGASLRAAWRGLALSETPHGEMLRCLQAVFEREGSEEGEFATVAYGVIDPGRTRLQITVAGHPPPILVTDDAAWVMEVAPGPPLGVFDETEWPISTTPLQARSAVVLYTDGLTEARSSPGSHERLGIDGLVAEIVATCSQPISATDLEVLAARVIARGGEPLADDAAILALSIHRDEDERSVPGQLRVSAASGPGTDA